MLPVQHPGMIRPAPESRECRDIQTCNYAHWDCSGNTGRTDEVGLRSEVRATSTSTLRWVSRWPRNEGTCVLRFSTSAAQLVACACCSIKSSAQECFSILRLNRNQEVRGILRTTF